MTGGTIRSQSPFGEDNAISAGYRLAMIVIHLPYVAPWSWPQFHQHIAQRLLPGLEALEPERYSRTVRVGDDVGWISVQPLATHPAL